MHDSIRSTSFPAMSAYRDIFQALHELPSDTRLSVELTPELEAWMRRTDFHAEKFMRHVIVFKTNIFDQLIASKCFGLIGKLALDSEEHVELKNRNLSVALAEVATEILSSLSMSGSVPRLAQGWLRLLHNHIYYLDDITSDMVEAVSMIICNHANRKLLHFRHHQNDENNQNQQNHMFLERGFRTLTRIALRLSSQKVESPLISSSSTEVIRHCTLCLQNNRLLQTMHPAVLFAACTTLASVAAVLEQPDIVEPAMMWLHWKQVLQTDTLELLSDSISNLSQRVESSRREHLALHGYLRSGESLHEYLALCSFPASSNIRFIGGVALTLVLHVLSSNAFDSGSHPYFNSPPPCDTPAARIYTEKAVQAHIKSDAKLARCHQNLIRRRRRQDTASYQVSTGPHTLLAEAVIRLTIDTSKRVRQIGQMAFDRLPLRVIQQAIWSPRLHKSFCREGKRIVLTMLMMSRRGDIPLDADLLVSCVFPFACVAI